MSKHDDSIMQRYFSKKFNFLSLRPDASGEARKRGLLHDYSVMVDYEAGLESNITYNRRGKVRTERLYTLDRRSDKTLKHISETGPDVSRSVTFLDDGSKIVRMKNPEFNKEYIRSDKNEVFVTHYSDDKYSRNVTFHDPKNPSLDHYTSVQISGTRSKLTIEVSGENCSGRLTINGKTYNFQAPREALRTDAQGNFVVTKKFAKLHKDEFVREGSDSTYQTQNHTSTRLADKFKKAGLMGNVRVPSFESSRSFGTLPTYASRPNSFSHVKDSSSTSPNKERTTTGTPEVSYFRNPSAWGRVSGFEPALEKRKGPPTPLKIIHSNSKPNTAVSDKEAGEKHSSHTETNTLSGRKENSSLSPKVVKGTPEIKNTTLTITAKEKELPVKGRGSSLKGKELSIKTKELPALPVSPMTPTTPASKSSANSSVSSSPLTIQSAPSTPAEPAPKTKISFGAGNAKIAELLKKQQDNSSLRKDLIDKPQESRRR